VIRELVPPDTALAYEAMSALRPWLPDEATFVARVDDVQRPEGYRLAAAFEDGRDTAVAVAGFRIGHALAWGRKHLYVDDLSTLAEARGRGHGRALLDWLAEEAAREGCEQLHLDSGLFRERVDAHRLYFNAGYHVGALHFMRILDR
jgi:GNAT superfamily N-acetyltransferase